MNFFDLYNQEQPRLVFPGAQNRYQLPEANVANEVIGSRLKALMDAGQQLSLENTQPAKPLEPAATATERPKITTTKTDFDTKAGTRKLSALLSGIAKYLQWKNNTKVARESDAIRRYDVEDERRHDDEHEARRDARTDARLDKEMAMKKELMQMEMDAKNSDPYRQLQMQYLQKQIDHYGQGRGGSGGGSGASLDLRNKKMTLDQERFYHNEMARTVNAMEGMKNSVARSLVKVDPNTGEKIAPTSSEVEAALSANENYNILRENLEYNPVYVQRRGAETAAKNVRNTIEGLSNAVNNFLGGFRGSGKKRFDPSEIMKRPAPAQQVPNIPINTPATLEEMNNLVY